MFVLYVYIFFDIDSSIVRRESNERVVCYLSYQTIDKKIM